MSLLVCYSLTAVFGVVLFGVGIILVPVFDHVIHSMVTEQMVISESSMTYDDWVSPNTPIYMQFWVWDLKNPAEVLQGELPFFEERGPYTYIESREKENITWNSNGTVSYKNKMKFVFDPSLSVGSEDDIFTTVNIPLVTVGTMIQHYPGIAKFLIRILSQLLSSELFLKLSVKDLVWGYEDPIFKLIHSLTGDTLVPSAEFGLFMDKNNSFDGVYNVFTGEIDIDKLNHVDMWHGRPNLTWWSTEEANMINGTDGTINPPFANISEPQYVFSSDVCRTIMGIYEKDVYYQGIKLVRFVGPDYIFANATEYPPNAGFCTPNTDHCLPSGLMNASVCQQGAPVVFSLPHFLYADQSVMLPTMYPDKEVHQTFVDADPITGITMRVAKRLQINIHLQKLEGIDQTAKLQEMFFPVLWLNESTELDDDTISEYKSSVQMPVEITKVVPWVVGAIGILLIVISVILIIRHYRKRNSEQISYNSSPGGESTPDETTHLVDNSKENDNVYTA
ncbi:lysosome membrane protein 2-like [Glandiceps talaboti]